MSAKVFLDTNVLVYAIGGSEERTETAEALLVAGGVVSVQVFNELASVARRKLGMAWEEVAEALAAIRIFFPSPAPITIETHDIALRIAMQHGYHIYDALVVASAIETGCAILYSEDLQDGQVIDGHLTIRNPFP
jgi:predicted nucleic acid-binding protein